MVSCAKFGVRRAVAVGRCAPLVSRDAEGSPKPRPVPQRRQASSCSVSQDSWPSNSTPQASASFTSASFVRARSGTTFVRTVSPAHDWVSGCGLHGAHLTPPVAWHRHLAEHTEHTQSTHRARQEGLKRATAAHQALQVVGRRGDQQRAAASATGPSVPTHTTATWSMPPGDGVALPSRGKGTPRRPGGKRVACGRSYHRARERGPARPTPSRNVTFAPVRAQVARDL